MLMKQKLFNRGIGLGLLYILLASCQGKKSIQVVPHSGHNYKWALMPFVKSDPSNPVLGPGPGTFWDPVSGKIIRWESKDVFNPAAVVMHDSIYLVYRAQDSLGKPAGTSRLGLAISGDGLHFVRRARPVLYPERDSMLTYEWEGGVEDPRIVESPDSSYILTYTAYDGKTARLCEAISHDLVHWKKLGLVFGSAGGGKFRNLWSKSGAIVAQLEKGHVIAKKIRGKYWMYWGDSRIFMATSADLVHWEPLENGGHLQSLFGPRKGYFDSRLVESGPFALWTGSGIVLIYNGMNDSRSGDSTLASGTYSGGQVLIDSQDPTRVLARLPYNFIRPDKPYELKGQVNRVCFLEGLAWFKGKWFLYYGTADSKIAVAVFSPGRRISPSPVP
ncbi:MAG TPA: glycoside hydrolase family 130 protein [Chitinophagaceae bacterium]|nr:glycoside hydrolase family 130 protein [Chitinophagaceae bacterium]